MRRGQQLNQAVLERKVWAESAPLIASALPKVPCPPGTLRMPVQLPFQRARLKAQRVLVYIAMQACVLVYGRGSMCV